MDVCCTSRRCTCTRRRYRPSSTPSRVQRLTTSFCGPPRRPPTVTSARGCCGESRARASAVQSAGSSVTKSARTFWMRTACRVSDMFLWKALVVCCAGYRSWVTHWHIDKMTDRLTDWPTDELYGLTYRTTDWPTEVLYTTLENYILVSCIRYERKLYFLTWAHALKYKM